MDNFGPILAQIIEAYKYNKIHTNNFFQILQHDRAQQFEKNEWVKFPKISR